MLLCCMYHNYYAQNYAGIIRQGLLRVPDAPPLFTLWRHQRKYRNLIIITAVAITEVKSVSCC